MTRQVGRVTLAAALIAVGAVFLVDNLTGLHLAWYVGRAWPLLLIFLGLEWVWSAREGGSGAAVRLDTGSMVGLVVIALVGSNVGAAYRAPFRINTRVPSVEVKVPAQPFVGGFAGGGFVMERTITYDQPVPYLSEVVVTDSSASVQVVKGDNFHVDLHLSGTGATQQQANDFAQTVRLNVVPGRVTNVSATRPGISNLRLTYQVTVPSGVNVRVNTSSGSVSAQGLDGTVNVQSSSGSVSVTDVAGMVVATSSSGSIQISGVKGTVRSNSTSGSIRVENPAAAVSAQSSSGSITVQAAEVGGNYDLSATSGSVRVTIPPDAGVTVTARASSGNVSGPQWLTLGEGRNSGSGTQGNGQRQIAIRTTSGHIQLDQR